MKTSAIVLALVFSLPLAAEDAKARRPDPAPLVPEYVLSVSDGGRLRTFFRENAWAKDFAASNLYRGAAVRLGPVFSAVASGSKDGWSGRLGDFLLDRVLDGRPVALAYFHAPGLASPFGVALPGLSGREREAARLVIRALRSGSDVPTRVAGEDGSVADVPVTPLALRMQRFAVVETPACVAVSRDPRVAATLSRSCTADPRAAAATLEVRTDEFFSSWSAVLTKLFGVGPRLVVAFDWDKRNARFVPAGASLALAKNHLLGTASVAPSILAAIPADAAFFATAVLPDPGTLDADSAEAYFEAARRTKPAAFVPVTVVSLGMRAGKDDRAEAMSVLLVPVAPASSATAVKGLAALFSSKGAYAVRATAACPGVVAVSPSLAALERVESACSEKQPSLKQAPPAVAATLTSGPVSAAAYLNVGGFLKGALLWGWRREGPPAPKGQEPPPPPDELKDALRLLDRLPTYAFSGRAAGDAVVLNGVAP